VVKDAPDNSAGNNQINSDKDRKYFQSRHRKPGTLKNPSRCNRNPRRWSLR
jgi:hypothetical protein